MKLSDVLGREFSAHQVETVEEHLRIVALNKDLFSDGKFDS